MSNEMVYKWVFLENYSYSFVQTCSRQIFACTLFLNVLLHSQSKPRYIELKNKMNYLKLEYVIG